MPCFQIKCNTVDAIVAPEPRKIFRAHVNDALVSRVVGKNRGNRKPARTVGCHQIERVVLANAMATGETFRYENARLRVKSPHQHGSIAGEELKLPPGPANHGQGDFRIAHRKFDLTKSI